MFIPESDKKLSSWADETVQICRASVGQRLAFARTMKQWVGTGSDTESGAIYNRLGPHIDRTASYLFSPSDLRFHIDFEVAYPEDVLMMADAAARYLTRQFDKQDIDQQFSAGMIPALTYGACLVKPMWGHNGLTSKLVMPWNFGVYREDRNDLYDQECVCETSYISKYEFWRRISHMSNRDELYKRAVSYAKKDEAHEAATSYFHNVVLAGTSPAVQTAPPYNNSTLGSVTPGFAPFDTPILATEVIDALLPFHELTVINDDTGDYSTIQIVEPDIIITKTRKNLFLKGELPYQLIQPNFVAGYFWGASECQYLLKLQALLRDRMEDIKQIMGLQYEKVLAFVGFSGMTDEMYDEFKQKHWIAQEQSGAKVEDLTPELPPNAFQEIDAVIKMMDDASGFQNILSGQGEPGVRAGTHAQTLMKTASPRLRDRAILVERQCADLGNTCLKLLRAKEPQKLWTKPEDPSTEFLLAQLPEDFRVAVDSHSSSPVYADDHKQLAAFLLKSGVIDGEDMLDLLPDIPMRESLKAKLRKREAAKQKFIQEHPEILTKGRGRPKV